MKRMRSAPYKAHSDLSEDDFVHVPRPHDPEPPRSSVPKDSDFSHGIIPLNQNLMHKETAYDPRSELFVTQSTDTQFLPLALALALVLPCPSLTLVLVFFFLFLLI